MLFNLSAQHASFILTPSSSVNWMNLTDLNMWHTTFVRRLIIFSLLEVNSKENACICASTKNDTCGKANIGELNQIHSWFILCSRKEILFTYLLWGIVLFAGILCWWISQAIQVDPDPWIRVQWAFSTLLTSNIAHWYYCVPRGLQQNMVLLVHIYFVSTKQLIYYLSVTEYCCQC